MALDKNGKELPKGITLRSDGRYMGRFTFKGESYTLYDKELKPLKKKMADLKYEVEHGIYAKESDITVEGWFNTWIEQYKINSVKRGTIERYMIYFSNYIKPYLGKKKLRDIRPEQIQKLYNDMILKGYSNATVNLTSTILKSMYKQAIKNKIVNENPVSLATLPKNKKKTERRVLSLHEQQLFLKYAENSQYYDLYRIALFTGMRSGELRALQWIDIDFKNETISVNGTLKKFTGTRYIKDTPKTAKSERMIPMLEGVAKILKQHKIDQMKMRLLIGNMWEADDKLNDLVFTSPTGKPLSITALPDDLDRIERNIKEHEPKIAFKHITPHTLRHTFATRGIENGITPKVMQEILGHSSLAMTMDLYAHVLPDAKANELKKIAYLL